MPPILCHAPVALTPISFKTDNVIPIIIVPGIMGTRLMEPITRKMVWNPLGFPLSMIPDRQGFGPVAVDADRLAKADPLVPVDASHIPVTTHPREKIQADNIPNFGNLVFDSYDKLAFELNNETFKQEMRGTTGKSVRVYACGYDWRQDNAVSARRLDQVV